MVTLPPELRPLSAANVLVWILISWTASGGGAFRPVLREGLLKYVPLNRLYTVAGRLPLMFMVGPERASVRSLLSGAFTFKTPGSVPASEKTLRPLSGRSATRRSSIVADFSEDRVSIVTAR